MDELMQLPEGYKLSVGDIVSFVTSYQYNIVKLAEVISLDGGLNWKGERIDGFCLKFHGKTSEQDFLIIANREDIRITLADLRNNKISKII